MTAGKAQMRSDRGYTLVETMIVMLMLGVVCTGIYTSFNTGMSFSGSQREVVDLQQQGRLALMNLERELRMTGYGYADLGNLTIRVIPPGSSTVQLWSIADSLDNIGSGSALAGTDSIKIRYSRASADLDPDVYTTQDHPSAAADIFVNSNDGFHQGDLFVIYDPRDLTKPGSLLQVSNDPTQGSSPKDKLIHNSGANGAYNPANATTLFPSGGYALGSRILDLGKGRQVSIYVDQKNNLVKEIRDNPDLTQPATSTRILAGGVEDLQLKYCFRDGQWLDAVVPGDANHDVNNLRALRVSLIMRSAHPSKNGGSASLTLSGSYGNGSTRSGGNYRRIMVTTVISLRNLGTRG